MGLTYEERRTGRTTAMLEWVLAAVQDGETLLVVAAHWAQVDYMFHLLLELMSADGLQNVRVNKAQRLIKVGERGVVRFTTISAPPLRGFNHSRVFFDHYALDVMTARQYIEFEEWAR